MHAQEYTISKVESVTKMEARLGYHQMSQGPKNQLLLKNSISLRPYINQGNPGTKERNKAIDLKEGWIAQDV
jgi:hypothetical protein